MFLRGHHGRAVYYGIIYTEGVESYCTEFFLVFDCMDCMFCILIIHRQPPGPPPWMLLLSWVRHQQHQIRSSIYPQG